MRGTPTRIWTRPSRRAHASRRARELRRAVDPSQRGEVGASPGRAFRTGPRDGRRAPRRARARGRSAARPRRGRTRRSPSCRGGTSPRSSRRATPPCSNAAAPKPLGASSGITALRSSTQTAPACQRSSPIGLTPPSPRNACHGGVTWNGRSAQKKRTAQRRVARVLDPVADVERRVRPATPPRTRWCVSTKPSARHTDDGIGSHASSQLLRDLGVGPGDEAPVGEQERLEREAAAIDLEHALFVQQRRRRAARDADRRPVALLAHQPARMQTAALLAARRCGRTRRASARTRSGATPMPTMPKPSPPRALAQVEPQEARRAARQRHVAALALGLLRRPQRRPRAAVVGALHLEGARGAARLPVDDEAAVLALRLEVERDPLRTGAARAAPARPRRAVEDRRRMRVPAAALDARTSGGAFGSRSSKRRSRDPDAALAAGAGRDRDLDRAELGDRAAAGRSPGELDLAAADPQRLPVGGELEGVAMEPPDVAPGRIGELELELVRRRRAAHLRSGAPSSTASRAGTPCAPRRSRRRRGSRSRGASPCRAGRRPARSRAAPAPTRSRSSRRDRRTRRAARPLRCRRSAGSVIAPLVSARASRRACCRSRRAARAARPSRRSRRRRDTGSPRVSKASGAPFSVSAVGPWPRSPIAYTTSTRRAGQLDGGAQAVERARQHGIDRRATSADGAARASSSRISRIAMPGAARVDAPAAFDGDRARAAARRSATPPRSDPRTHASELDVVAVAPGAAAPAGRRRAAPIGFAWRSARKNASASPQCAIASA